MKNIDDFEWKKGELVTYDGGNLLGIAVRGYNNNQTGVCFYEKVPYVLVDEDDQVFSYREMLNTLKKDFFALDENNNELFELPYDESAVSLVDENGDVDEAVCMDFGLTEEEVVDLDARLTALTDEYWQIIEQDM